MLLLLFERFSLRKCVHIASKCKQADLWYVTFTEQIGY